MSFAAQSVGTSKNHAALATPYCSRSLHSRVLSSFGCYTKVLASLRDKKPTAGIDGARVTSKSAGPNLLAPPYSCGALCASHAPISSPARQRRAVEPPATVVATGDEAIRIAIQQRNPWTASSRLNVGKPLYNDAR